MKFRFLAAACVLMSASPAWSASRRVILQTSVTWNGDPIQYFGAYLPNVKARTEVIEAGGYRWWSFDPVSPYAYVLEGELEVRLADGTVQHFSAGDAFVGARSSWYYYGNPGSAAARLVTFHAGGLWFPYVAPPWILNATTTSDGAPLKYFRTRCPEVLAMTVHIGANEVGGIQLHPVNKYVYVLNGSITVEMGDVGSDKALIKDNTHYQSRVYGRGEAFAEPPNRWHVGIGGPAGVDLLVWYTTEEGYSPSVNYSPDYVLDPDLADSSKCSQSRGP